MRWLTLILPLCFFAACKQKQPAWFEVLDASKTGLHFSNNLKASDSFNVFRYMYFYNGAGVGAGDFNNDGLTDLFFASNQDSNRLYINSGNLQFADKTIASGLPQDGGWSTGVSVVDINNDGLLDIYICRVGNYEQLRSKNQLLVCTGIDDGVPRYEDKAEIYGLAYSGFSTQASFFDYDGDGDLDLFLLNHAVHQNGSFAERGRFLGRFDPLSGDKIFANEGGIFRDVTDKTGIHSSAIGYGLGIAVSDINLDGYPDIYIGNDFHENDYLYINQRNGQFADQSQQAMMHTSQFSMGVDVADINNDGFPEIISADMLPDDPYMLKRSLGEDEYNTFHMKLSYGYQPQYARNNLQLNRGNNLFSEIGLYAGVAATDWSWAPLWFDFDNDGLRDLFVSNGIPKRLNDIDYVNYVSNQEVQRKINQNKVDEKEMAVIDQFPQIKIPNRLFKNIGKGRFNDIAASIEGNLPTFSNGAVYADLDNDGDLDVVVNNIDDKVLVYRNNAEALTKNRSVMLKLKGPAANTNAIGAKLVLWAGDQVLIQEKQPVRGFMSSMETPLHMGLGNFTIDSAVLVWPDNTFQPLPASHLRSEVFLEYRLGLPKFDYTLLQATSRRVEVVMHEVNGSGLTFMHRENPFNEFDREPLIPFMVSREGPALAVGDANGDGFDDVFLGASKRERAALYVQENGNFKKIEIPAIAADSVYEDVDAAWLDVNNDGLLDLVVASGGNEYYGEDEHLAPRLYINKGGLQFERKAGAFNIGLTASCLAAHDFDGDGWVDIFIGARAQPWNYGLPPKNYLLKNRGNGSFTDVTHKYPALSDAGLIKSATWASLSPGQPKSLVVAAEWGALKAYQISGNEIKEKVLTEDAGLWNFILPCDLNGDGHTDFIAGNLGLNSRLQASKDAPVRLYINDFDNNGRVEQVLTHYLQGKEVPFANKDEIQRQLPLVKKEFLYAADFAKASLTSIFPQRKLKEAITLEANELRNLVLLSNGKGSYTKLPLPWKTQLSSYRDAVIMDVNSDGLPDIFLGGNFYDNNIQMGRYDADYGSLLLNKGNGRFVPALTTLPVKGQVRNMRTLMLGRQPVIIIARNNDSTMVLQPGQQLK